MSRQHAPLYTRAHALCCFVGERLAAGAPAPPSTLNATEREARELLCALSLALTFPPPRLAWLQRADEHVVRLRALLALARDLRQASPGWVRAASAQVDEIGRMLGGWQRSLARAADVQASKERTMRRRARAAASASCAAAVSGTTPTTAAPQPATGTSPTGTATTTASASSLPPSPEPEEGAVPTPG